MTVRVRGYYIIIIFKFIVCVVPAGQRDLLGVLLPQIIDLGLEVCETKVAAEFTVQETGAGQGLKDGLTSLETLPPKMVNWWLTSMALGSLQESRAVATWKIQMST